MNVVTELLKRGANVDASTKVRKLIITYITIAYAKHRRSLMTVERGSIEPTLLY